MWQYLLNLEINVNYKKKNKTSLINVIQFAFNRIFEINKLTNTTNVNINKKNNIYKSLFDVATKIKHDNIVTILLNYKINVYKNFFLSNAM